MTGSSAADKIAALRKKADSEPLPEPVKFENFGDELAGSVRSLGQTEINDRDAGKKLVWQLVVSGQWVSEHAEDGEEHGAWSAILTEDLVDQLVTQREVRPGDFVLIRYVMDGGRKKLFNVQCDPDRPYIDGPPAAPADDDDPGF